MWPYMTKGDAISGGSLTLARRLSPRAKLTAVRFKGTPYSSSAMSASHSHSDCERSGTSLIAHDRGVT